MIIKILMGFSVYILFICFLIVLFVKMLNFLCESFIGDKLNIVFKRVIDGKSLKNEEEIDTIKPLKSQIKSKFYSEGENCKKRYIFETFNGKKYMFDTFDLERTDLYINVPVSDIKGIYEIGYIDRLNMFIDYPIPKIIFEKTDNMEKTLIQKHYVEPYEKVFGIDEPNVVYAYGTMFRYLEETEPYTGDKER